MVNPVKQRVMKVNPVKQRVMKVNGMGVGEVLCQGLVNVQSNKSREVVTTMGDVLEELGLKEEATQLRGLLIC